MTTEPPPSSAVAPVIDYEPPAAPRRPAPALTTRSARPGRGHAPRKSPGRPAHGLAPALRSAAVFADAALRRVLEVVDQRRPPTHLQPLLAAGLAESVLSVRPVAPPGRGDPATLQRVRVKPAGSGEPTAAVEAFGTYRRGQRTHALACRLEQVAGRSGWQIVALHIG